MTPTDFSELVRPRDERIQRLEKELVELVRRTAAGTVTKIDLIRAYRNATDAGLKDSKDYIESLQPPPLPPSELSVITARLEVLEKWQAACERSEQP